MMNRFQTLLSKSTCAATPWWRGTRTGCRQGLTLVHFSVQLEPCLTHKNTLHTFNTPYYPLNMGHTTPKHTPYPIKVLKLS